MVAINNFVTDSDEELKVIKDKCSALGIDAVYSEVWAKGGGGAIELAEKVSALADSWSTPFNPVYDWSWSVEEKIEAIAKKVYGAKSVDYSVEAKSDIKRIKTLNLSHLPICMAKTQKSLSDNPDLIGRPRDFVLTVREIEIASGAGFLVPITGEMMRMPGLPDTP